MIGAAILAAMMLGAAPSPATAAVPAAVPAAKHQDWTAIVAATPQGGVRIGNPDAKVKLVEYGSVGCSHCASFAAAANAPLRANYIATGNVSFEFRPLLIFATDPAASRLLACTAPAGYFAALDTLFAARKDAAARVEALAPAEQERIGRLAHPARNAAYAKATGFDAIFRAQGMTGAQQESCLGDEAGLDRLYAITDRAIDGEGVRGTPAFLINGALVEDVTTWEALEPRLKGALGA
jgi:protein-disulfide isomerase